MDGLQEQLAALFDTILSEARENERFARRLERALSRARQPTTSTHATKRTSTVDHDRRRRSNRRAKSPVDPFAVFDEGEDRLRSVLGRLDVEQLKDVVAEYGMDRSRLALKWKSPERLVELIVDTVKTRARKGDAFRAAPGDAPGPGTE